MNDEKVLVGGSFIANRVLPDTEAKFNPVVQLNTRVSLEEKQALMVLAKNKGAKDFKGLLRILSTAKEVNIVL